MEMEIQEATEQIRYSLLSEKCKMRSQAFQIPKFNKNEDIL